jgi:transposase
VVERRKEFCQQLASIDPQRLKFIDESGATTAMTRMYGRAPAGERVADAVPGGHWKVTSMIAALSADGAMEAAVSIQGAIDADVFGTYVREVLVPTLSPGDVVVMDNLCGGRSPVRSSHKVFGIREAIESAGASLLYLPPYSPDLNPIEKAWSKVKKLLRDAAARTQEALENAITTAMAAVTSSDAKAFFRSCGYPSY